jgi:hypothetical protein
VLGAGAPHTPSGSYLISTNTTHGKDPEIRKRHTHNPSGFYDRLQYTHPDNNNKRAGPRSAGAEAGDSRVLW